MGTMSALASNLGVLIKVNHSEHATPTVSAGANPRWLKVERCRLTPG